MSCTIVNGDFEDDMTGWTADIWTDYPECFDWSYSVLGDPGSKYFHIESDYIEPGDID